MKLKEKLAKSFSNSKFEIHGDSFSVIKDVCNDDVYEEPFLAGFHAAQNLVLENLLMTPLNLMIDKIRKLGEEEV